MSKENILIRLKFIGLVTIILSLPFFLTNCTKEKVDLDTASCDSGCFIIQGSFYDSVRAIPVGGLSLTLRHRSYNGGFIPYNRHIGTTTTNNDGSFKISLDPTEYVGSDLFFELRTQDDNYAVKSGVGYSSMITEPLFTFKSDTSIIDTTIVLDVKLIPKSYVSIELANWPANTKSISLWPKGILSGFSNTYFSQESFPVTLPIAAYSESELEVTIKKEGNTTNQNKKLLSKGIGETQTVKLFL